MIVIEKLKAGVKAVTAIFTRTDKNPKAQLSGMDMAEIFVALLPALIFGAMAFGIWGLIVPVICSLVCGLTSIIWDLITEREHVIKFHEIWLTGFILGLTLGSDVNIVLAVVMSVLTALLQKTVFRKKPLYIIFPILIVKVLFAAVFFRWLSVYALPFQDGTVAHIPLDYIFLSENLGFSAKWLFFGLQSGNIGEISEFLLIIGGIYLMIRKLVRPEICASFVVTSAVLSLIFNEKMHLSLLGGGLFFAAVVLTMDYGFLAQPLYKRLLYGVLCGLLTFVLRLLFKTEAAFMAVAVCDFAFIYITRRNIKRAVKFCKNPDFKKLLKKTKKVFGF